LRGAKRRSNPASGRGALHRFASPSPCRGGWEISPRSSVSARRPFPNFAVLIPRQRAAMFLLGHTRKNSQRRGLTVRTTLFKIDDGGSRKGSKGNAVRVLRGTLYRGCPRNCERRVFGRHDHWDVKILGRWPKAATREPGHLPPATSHARTRWAGCPGVNVRVRPLRGCCPGRMAERATAKIAVTGYGFAVEAWQCCLSSAAVARATVFAHRVLSSSPHRR
jgi:hypothetical protein